MTTVTDLPLFAAARARASDPATSHEAARRTDARSGRAIVLEQLALEPGGLTMHEVAARAGVPLVNISSRFSDLRRAGLIEAAGKANGRTIWRAIP